MSSISMKKSIAFGTFDVIHKGHEHYLTEAKKKGDYLIVVVAADETVEAVKKRMPMFPAEERKKHVEQLKIADKVIIGSKGDKLKVVLDEKPDVICLGYDQDSFTEKLETELAKKGLKPKIVRIKSFKPDIYKSSIIKRKRARQA